MILSHSYFSSPPITIIFILICPLRPLFNIGSNIRLAIKQNETGKRDVEGNIGWGEGGECGEGRQEGRGRSGRGDERPGCLDLNFIIAKSIWPTIIKYKKGTSEVLPFCFWWCLCLNNFIMKVNQQRNPYLKRIYSQTPHKYSYDMDSGKYLLLDESGKATNINLNGTFRPKFRPNYSGFVGHKARYNDSVNDPSVLHFAPDPNPQTQYHNPMPDKFAGYAQLPYQLKKQLPHYLKKPNQTPKYPRRKTKSLIMDLKNETKTEIKKKQIKANNSAILEYSTFNWAKDPDTSMFNSAWKAQCETKPLPKQKKKTCYNYKCKYMRQWTFDTRGQLEQEKVVIPNNTQARSFHEGALTQEMQESKLISTMAFSGIA